MASTEATDEPRREARANPRSRVVRIAVTIGVLFVLYILSLGPILWATTWADIGGPAASCLSTFYAPLKYLHDHTALKGPLDDYIGLWVDLSGRFPRKWSSGRRIIYVTLDVADAGNAQPIAGARITAFDHPRSTVAEHCAALDGAEYDVEVFTTGADGSSRFRRAFPLYTESLLQSKENVERPGTWVEISAPGYVPIVLALDLWIGFPPKNPSDEKPLVMSVALVAGDDQPRVIAEGFPSVVNGLRENFDPGRVP